ncbi:Dopamine receptor 1 [Armadillidium vulgare]|nr:Dopamine receptor 1 [Armadillidium vulgare]
MTKKIVTLSIAAIWLVSALVSFLPISSITAIILEMQDSNQCALDLTPTFAVVSSTISFFFPCIVMLVLYTRLYSYAKKHVASIKAQFRPVTLGALDGDNTKPRKVAAPYHVSESKAATTVGIIVGTFLICWVPFFCVNIAAAFCKTCISPLVFKENGSPSIMTEYKELDITLQPENDLNREGKGAYGEACLITEEITAI